MAQTKSLWVTPAGFKLGQSGIGKNGVGTGTIKQTVHDGDTVNVLLLKNLGVRFLGIDTPEISFQLPGEQGFTAISNAKWDTLFTSGAWKAGLPVGNALLHYLQHPARIGNGANVAANHSKLADDAQHALEKLIQDDLTLSGKTKEQFLYFMAFANEFLDVYGRLLTYLHSDRSNFSNGTTTSELSYNEKQLADGWACPYFIWPNVQPFISVKPFSQANVQPAGFWPLIQSATKLNNSRQAVKAARALGKGIFNHTNHIKLMPFELRYIARKKAPDRFLIDLSDVGNNKLLHPEQYFTVNPEDRLFIPAEYIPIFESFGWHQ